jgi:hypothetical protein
MHALLTVTILALSLLLAGWVNPAEPDRSESLFDGETLGNWEVTNFGGQGSVEVKDGSIVLENGGPMTGITWTAEYPKVNYEVNLEARRIEGGDIFCCLTFPVKDAFCSFVVGGWGGHVVGLSSIDGWDASDNETTRKKYFSTDRWYRIRVRVTEEKIQAWIDDEQMVDVEQAGRDFSVRPDVWLSRPLGIATWGTAAELRDLRLVRLGSYSRRTSSD